MVLLAPQRIQRWVPAPTSVHLCGSVPIDATSPQQVMQWILDHLHGGKLLALAFDTDRRWIINWLNSLRTRAAFELVRDGDSRGYDRVPSYRVAPGHELSPADLALGRPQQVREAMAVKHLLTGDVPDQLQVSVPNALDLSYFAAGSAEAAEDWLPATQQMLTAEVAEIAAEWGSAVRYQLESPSILASYHSTPREAWPALTQRLVQQVAGVLQAAPGADWILHLCYGDLEHSPLFVPADLSAAVMFANALADHLDTIGISMPTVHLPVAHGTAAPSIDPVFYTSLLRLRRDIRVIAGVVAEHHPEATRAALEFMADALGGVLGGIGAGCGHGRRDEADADANIKLNADLAAEYTTLVCRQAA